MEIVKGKDGHKIVFKMKPGVCQCGCLVCVKCRAKLDQDSWKGHVCNQGGGSSEMDAKTLATLQKIRSAQIAKHGYRKILAATQ